jgi:hypothetical protein
MLPVLVAFIGIGFLADGYTDPFYLKFTSPRQTSLIIGVSRAALGLRPEIFNRALEKEYPQLDLYNFAFAFHSSPFGKVYLDAIENKLQENSKNGLFIITVDPWTIADFTNETGEETRLREYNSFLGRTKWVNGKPNLFYLVNGYDGPYMKILATKVKTRFMNNYPNSYLHENGWMEATFPMDSQSVRRRLQASLDKYDKMYLPQCAVSPARISWLIKTISFLQRHGDVYLVRLPVHPSLLVIDNKLFPRFDTFIDSVARQQNIPYFNFSDSCARYNYFDGVHLTIQSATRVSGELARLMARRKHER